MGLRDEIIDLSTKTRHGNDHTLIGRDLVFPTATWVSASYGEKRTLLAIAAAMRSRGSILVSRSAARVIGMWVVALSEETVELALASGGSSARRRTNPRYTYRYARLRPGEFGFARDIKVTIPERTFLDIARYHGFVEALIALEGLLFHGFDLADIERFVARQGRFKGIAVVRRCLVHAVAVSESPYETLARALLIEAGITGITAQYPIGDYRADIAIEGWLLIEIDGAVKYGGPDAEAVRQREFERQKKIGNLGYVFLRYTPTFLMQTPEQFVAEVRLTLENRGQRIPR